MSIRHLIALGRPLPWRKRVLWQKRFYDWKKKALAENLPRREKTDVCAVLLSYKRPQNIETIIQCLLRTPSVGRILVSNNHPDVRLQDWVSIHNPKLTLIDQRRHESSFLSVELASKEKDYDHFLLLDDDLFLLPSQLEKLCEAICNDPSRVHGVTGQVYDTWRGMMYHHQTGDGVVDNVSRVYAAHAAHIARALELRNVHDIGSSSYFTDLLLSFSSDRMPKTVDVGAWLDCPSEEAPGKAVRKEPEFFERRLPVFMELRRRRERDHR